MEENKTTHFPTGKREVLFGLLTVLVTLLAVDFLAYGGLNLAFGLMALGLSLISWLYLVRSGCKIGGHSLTLLILEAVITLSLMRSDDGLVKFVMLCFGLVAGNLSLSLISGNNRYCPKGVTSLLEVPRAIFNLGVGELPNSFGGLNDARKSAGTLGKKNLAVLTGLVVAVPVLAVLIPLLMKADAAFEGLLNLLPKMDLSEPFVVVLLGLPIACVLYTRNTALRHGKVNDASVTGPKAIHPATVVTVLILVAVVYLVYLFSQLAYFVGGFSGILPAEYTLAQYARRGFFEMGWLSAINLAIIGLAAGLAEIKEGKTPLSIKLLCLFVGAVTLFFVAAASGKMLLYIGSYGLTRLRLLTQVVMIFIGITVIFVALWLFAPKFAYMKAILLTALVMGAAVSWADVDTVVAAYNVGAYRSGALEKIDIDHLAELGDGAVPYLQQLTQDPDAVVANQARDALIRRAARSTGDFRRWNIASALARDILQAYEPYVSELEDQDFYFSIAPDQTMDQLGCRYYSTAQLQRIAGAGSSLKTLTEAYPAECVRVQGEDFRLVYRSADQVAVIVFDWNLNVLSRDIYDLCGTKADLMEIAPGCSMDFVSEVTDLAYFADGYSDHFTADGWWFRFEYDENSIITDIKIEPI